MKIKHALAIFGLLMASCLVKCHAVWDTTTPAGSEAKSLGDDRIREFKTDVQTALQFEGDFPGPDTSNPRFIYTPSSGTTAQRPMGSTNTAAGMFFVNTSSNCLERYDGANWNCIAAPPSNLNLVVTTLTASTVTATNQVIAATSTSNGFRFSSENSGFALPSAGVVAGLVNGTTQFSISSTGVNASTYSWRGFSVLQITQIVEGTPVDVSSSTTATSYVNTLSSVTITPKSTSSKILVIATGQIATTAGTGNAFATISRGSTNLYSPSNGVRSGDTSTSGVPVTMYAYDSPGTTASTTYFVQIKHENGSASTRWGINTNVASCKMIAIELGQ